MKKFVSVLLVAVMCLSCLGVAASAAPPDSFTTESGLEVYMEKVLYKSSKYTMEFPSAEDYSIKLTSTPGDYAIPGNINDLSYKIIFPAGTTSFTCKLSLDGVSNWYGANVSCERHPHYWETDENGSIDLSQPVTFDRPEKTAERDEYGLLYRFMLYEKGVGGYKDYDKLYWRIEYTCNEEKFTDYIEIKLLDFDADEQHTLTVLNYNVAGLPWAGTAAKQRVNGGFITDSGYDIVAVQEDFGYHSALVSAIDGYGYQTCHMGGVPGGDGLNIFTKDMPIYNETRVTWDEAFGVIDHGADTLTPKGFVYSVIDIGNGIYVDFYNLHADAFSDEGSVAARTAQFRQLADFINEKYEENNRPVIVTGDFNTNMRTHSTNSNMYAVFVEECGFKDAWVELKNESNYFSMSRWISTGKPSWGNWDSVERFFYKGTDSVAVVATDFEYIEVLGDNGKPASDHAAAYCKFTFVTADGFEPETQQLEVTLTDDGGIAKRLKWITADFVSIVNNYHEIFTALERVVIDFLVEVIADMLE